MQSIFSSFIQSDFSANGHGNFEAVIKVGGDLLHYFRDNADDQRLWYFRSPVVEGNVAFPGALIQSDFRRGEHGNYEVLVPLFQPNGVTQLWHYFLDNSAVANQWARTRLPVTEDGVHVTGPASLIQSDFGHDGSRNLEAVVPLMGPQGHSELWHFWFDITNVHRPWTRGRRITADGDRVTGPASIIQSDYKTGDHGNFEVVVPLIGRHGHPSLFHFFHDNANPDSDWVRLQQITGASDVVAGGGVIIQSDLGDGGHGNFEVVVPLLMPHGHTELWHFFYEADRDGFWKRAQMITASASGGACIVRSDFAAEGHNDFEVLVDECTQSVVHYWRRNANIVDPWLRGGLLADGKRLLGEVPDTRLTGTAKIVQLTGEWDRQGWGGSPEGQPRVDQPRCDDPPFAHNRTESRFGIRGLDLGVSFLHKNRIYFLFGDTIRNPHTSENDNLDSIAFCTDTDPDNGLDLTFFKEPPRVRDNAISQRGFEVPIDGVSHFGSMFVFFTTNARRVGHADIMGRCVVAISQNDGDDFTYLWDVSRDKFINVSVEVVDGASIGLRSFGKTLLIFGSGRYRSSDVYLAAMPLDEIASGRFVRYYAGQQNGEPIWGFNEGLAVPLFCAGCVGELSVRWNPFLKRWVILYNADNPRGIVLRTAEHPWGEWSGPTLAFDPRANNGFGQFMHVKPEPGQGPQDFLDDDLIDPPRRDITGGEYGPYQIAPLAKGVPGHSTQLYFVMSTWNPYQVMLMTTIVMASRTRASLISDHLTDSPFKTLP